MDKLKIPSKTALVYSSVIFVLVVINITLLILISKPIATVKESESEISTEDETADEDGVPENHPCRDFRLPKHVLPVHFGIKLHPDMENDIFFGEVNITVRVTKETGHIIFHSHPRTNITSVALYSPFEESEITLKKTFPYHRNSYFVLETEDQLKTGVYEIRMEYRGHLRDDKLGFFKMNYVNKKNETRSVVASKFQPFYARHAFPCFDEPGFKSTYTIRLVHPPNYFALSNMPVENVQPYGRNLVLTTFEISKVMVSYLAEFIVCDFNFTSTMTSKGIPMRVYSTPDKVEQTKYALIFGRRVLDYFEYYFGIEYSLPKFDMISFPEWASGGTEHWGIVTYPERNLLYDEERTLPYHMQRLTSVIAHEIAHMWFGNLVTAEWWDDIWLHEGFASYIEYLGIQELHPDWDIMSQFVIADMESAKEREATVYIDPLIRKANNNREIMSTFRGTTYPKGATLLRMIESFMGKETFRKGISNFLKKFQYKIVKTPDLWKELDAVYKFKGNYTFSDVMKSWTERAGFPYINIKREGNSFIVRQKRYLKAESSSQKYRVLNNNKTVWSIPLSYKTSGGTSGIKWIHNVKEKITLPINANETLKFNTDCMGYYIVNYEREDWDKLTDVLLTNHEALSPLDRSNLLLDAIYLSETVHTSYDTFLSLTRYLRDETHYVPWEAVYRTLIEICLKLEFTDADILCKNYIYDLTKEIYKKVEWKKSKNHLKNLLYPAIIQLSCFSGNPFCLTKAAEMFQNWTHGHSIPDELQNIVIPYGMAEIGRDEHLDFLLNKFTHETDTKWKGTYISTFAAIKIPSLIQKFLLHLVEKNDSWTFLAYLAHISTNSIARPYVFSFVREQWIELKNRFQNKYFRVVEVAETLIKDISSVSELTQVKHFLEKYRSAEETDEDLQRVYDKIIDGIKWSQTYVEDIKLWFLEQDVSQFRNYAQLF